MVQTKNIRKGIAMGFLYIFLLITIGAVIVILVFVFRGNNIISNAVNEMLLLINSFFNW